MDIVIMTLNTNIKERKCPKTLLYFHFGKGLNDSLQTSSVFHSWPGFVRLFFPLCPFLFYNAFFT